MNFCSWSVHDAKNFVQSKHHAFNNETRKQKRIGIVCLDPDIGTLGICTTSTKIKSVDLVVNKGIPMNRCKSMSNSMKKSMKVKEKIFCCWCALVLASKLECNTIVVLRCVSLVRCGNVLM